MSFPSPTWLAEFLWVDKYRDWPLENDVAAEHDVHIISPKKQEREKGKTFVWSAVMLHCGVPENEHFLIYLYFLMLPSKVLHLIVFLKITVFYRPPALAGSMKKTKINLLKYPSFAIS